MNRVIARTLLVCLPFAALPVASAAEANRLTAEELADGWILLFDGHSTFGWQPGSKANWKVADGVISVDAGEPGLLATTSQFADYTLKVDFRHPPETNSGIFLRTPLVPKDPAGDCYELNIAAEKVSPFPTGSFVGRKKIDSPPDGASDNGAPGGDVWRSYEITAEAGRFIVKLDGRLVLDYTDPNPLHRGQIGLQFNTGRAEFRNVKLKPLSLATIFNGKDLAGWKVFPGKTSVFSVTPDGWLNVKNGNGQLESDERYADFILQLEIISNGKHLNSGVFFRSIPGEFWQGYESQIHSGFRDGDRTKPQDCGTGGFYRRQDARKVVADDFEWFSKTLVVSGNHMATWVNGYQVSDWTDTRDAHENPRQGLRTAAGTLAIQGHDPTTDLSFRSLRIVELPDR